jgi:serralysin
VVRLHSDIQRVWYAPAILAVALAGSALATPPVPSYNSLIGASHTLYLDFDGINYSGTWDGLTPGNVPAYDIDGNPSAFNSAELNNIQQIWGRVAEAYSPFNVNVTTVSPGTTPAAGQWSQIVIAAENASGSDWYGNAGGTAQMGGFTGGGMERGTGWAFTNHLANGNPKYTAVSATHEAGHLFGLDHQRQFDESGKLLNEYRPSADGNLTAPLMGSPYSAVRALWSDGARFGPNDIQLDRNIVAQKLGYRPDDNNHDFAHAKPLTVTGGFDVATAGIIEQPTEDDFFSFSTAAGQVTINVLRDSYGGMLDSVLRLYRQDHTLLQTIDPALSLTGPDYGLDASFTGYLAEGTYYLEVASHGEYGDVGQYTVTGILAPEPGTCVELILLAGWLLAGRRWRKPSPR